MRMMNRRFALSLVAAGAVPLRAEDPPTGSEPDDIGAVFRLRSGRLEPLESRRARWAKRHQKMFTERDLLNVEGIASTVRFKRGEPLEFVVRCLMQPRGFERLPLPPSL